MSHSKTPKKAKLKQARSRSKKPGKGAENHLPVDPSRDQAGHCPRPPRTAQGCNDRRHHEGNRLARALGPRLLCRRRAEETWADLGFGEGRWRAGLSCDHRERDQIASEFEHVLLTGRLA